MVCLRAPAHENANESQPGVEPRLLTNAARVFSLRFSARDGTQVTIHGNRDDDALKAQAIGVKLGTLMIAKSACFEKGAPCN